MLAICNTYYVSFDIYLFKCFFEDSNLKEKYFFGFLSIFKKAVGFP